LRGELRGVGQLPAVIGDPCAAALGEEHHIVFVGADGRLHLLRRESDAWQTDLTSTIFFFTAGPGGEQHGVFGKLERAN
jgi:hypothetical protein